MEEEIVMPCVGIDTVCEYKNCKQEAFYEIAKTEADNENGIYRHRCKKHIRS